MKKIYFAALFYMIAGLAAGLFYREFTKASGFTGDSQLTVTHTHLLALGMLFFLGVLALDKIFELSKLRSFTLFFWIYNAGLLLTVAMMFVSGIMTVNGAKSSAAISGIAGMGHIVITVGLVFLFVALGSRILGSRILDARILDAKAKADSSSESPQA